MITILILAAVFVVGVLLGRWAMKKYVQNRPPE